MTPATAMASAAATVPPVPLTLPAPAAGNRGEIAGIGSFSAFEAEPAMSTYAIGDVQGCYAELRSLLRACGFDARRDRLWFAGDLVNRGPNSLDVLRFAADFGDRAHVVLGNHDLHLVASARGIRKPRARDTFHDVLDAADGEALIDWLRTRPMIHHDPERACVMVHAGIPPAWTIADAIGHGGELSRALRAPNHPRLVAHLYGNKPDEWRDALAGFDRLRFIANAFTRMRYCHADGRLDFSETRPPGDQDPSLTPWFMLRDGGVDRVRIVFGHWATLQLRTALPRRLHVRHIDTGCVWGGSLTALRLDDDREFAVACEGGAR